MLDGLNILVAEDDAGVAMMLTGILDDLGHRVVAVVDTAEAAIAAAAKHPVDLALVDVWLARGSNGLTAVRVLAGRHGIPSIVCSAHSLAEEAQAAGAVAFLGKPFRMAELEAALLRAPTLPLHPPGAGLDGALPGPVPLAR
ncbi:response regulator [Azospirillum rugosum]|uniref:CheY-like chemotaxis protein n=1 Tax=Azospirillum rugosum TaxID=416170 RepID=A0ABS4SED4_9PROT|nr:response regulator [Azospirillum rugosum]MBP2290936.1 CheY-like chemotaxis protein [Azospirillum rugosum]MDQ0525000.1 CheY-like chemotaxis protein [Azospirillum rugosum]